MGQQQSNGWIAGVRRSGSRGARRVVAVALAVSALSSMVGGAAVVQAAGDCRAPRLAANVQDFGSPFVANLASAIAGHRDRSGSGSNPEDFGAPAPGG